jgi:predicted transcriptional regulator of viral defense system
MKKLEAIHVFREFDKKGRFVFTKSDLSKLFPGDNQKAFDEGLNRLVKSSLLVRACRGVYVNDHAQSMDSYVIEHIAKALRRGEYSYVSLESILSEYGIISQIPIDRLTVMTTGREGIYQTPYGVIEFTHTKRTINDILHSVHAVAGRPLRVANKQAAIRDLKRVGRNINLLQQDDDDE